MEILPLHLKNLLDYAAVRGFSQSALGDILPAEWEEEHATIDAETFYVVIAEVNSALQDPLLGIKAGNFMALKLLGLIYQISLLTQTIEEAFHYLQSYLTATFPVIKAETKISGDFACVDLAIPNGEAALNRIVLENVLTIISREVRMMSGGNLVINLTSPFYSEEYPAGWSLGSDYSVSFGSVILKNPLKKIKQLHLDVLIPEYLKMIGQLGATEKFSDKVKLTMLSMSDPALPDIDSICNVLYLTPRTLQRRLMKEEVTYRQITEELKKQICSFLIMHEPYPISSLSYILGYSEPASFIHSFKKWYGDSPQRVRKSLRNAG
jgi:AraC-like DNA-binding protein